MTVTTLIIARHGNTFAPGEPPRRVGRLTDLPLVASGEEQAVRLGKYLKEHLLIPDRIVTSTLQRTQQTALLAAQAMGWGGTSESSPLFDELDYGPDENRDESDVRARLGEAALRQWEEQGVLPPGSGWSPDAATLRQCWRDFATELFVTAPQRKTLVVTSNGVARFALSLTEGEKPSLKLATGGFGVLTRRNDESFWRVVGWNIRP